MGFMQMNSKYLVTRETGTHGPNRSPGALLTKGGFAAKSFSVSEYREWLVELKSKVRRAQIKAAVRINADLLFLYWSLGEGIVVKQAQSKWGEGLLARLSRDLIAEFPDMQGFSLSNLKYMKQWYLFYTRGAIGQQVVGQLGRDIIPLVTQIPWGHNIVIFSKCRTVKEAVFYVKNTIQQGWSRNVLVHQIESALWQREGKAVTNFKRALPKPHSDLAQQTLKDPYIFDFLSMRKDVNERDLESAFVSQITKFLLELGAGFSFVGRQFPVVVGSKEFFIDLLLYHTRLHSDIVVELKTGDFEPANAGQVNFYIKAVDQQLRKQGDGPTIGLLLCKNRDKLVAEYALSDIHKPIGVSEYHLSDSLPKELKSSLPTTAEIEKELSGGISKRKGNFSNIIGF